MAEKLKIIKIIQGMYSDHNRTKLEINIRKITGTFSKTWKLNDIF